jgi:hypothetical protein
MSLALTGCCPHRTFLRARAAASAANGAPEICQEIADLRVCLVFPLDA